ALACFYSHRRATLLLGSTLHRASAAAGTLYLSSLGSCDKARTLTARGVPRYIHSGLVGDAAADPFGRPFSTCGAVACWEMRYALLALFSFAVVFPSMALGRHVDVCVDEDLDVHGRHADMCVDGDLDVHVAPLFRAEANLLKALIVLGREIDRPSIYPPLVIAFFGTQ
ncbi:hypothetical protein T484DRAFT_1811109, partial [Baffinella frigidus]